MNNSSSVERVKVCVQGLGYVGAAMVTAVASASNNKRQRLFDVTGLDLPTDSGIERIKAINRG